MPGGRPTLLHHPVTLPDGTHTTTGNLFLTCIALGMPADAAAKRAGTAESTVRSWRLKGGAARHKVEAGLNITTREAEYVTFLTDYEAADAKAMAVIIGAIEDAGLKPQTIVRTVVKHALVEGEMVETERTQTTEVRPPDVGNLRWLAARRWASQWGDRVAVDLPDSGEGGTTEDRARRLSGQVEAYLAAEAESSENERAAVTPDG